MSSTASLRRTDLASDLAAAFDARRVTTILAAVMLAAVLISFRPFQVESTAPESGDIVNQIGFGSLGALALFSMLGFVRRRKLSALLSPSWLLLLCFLALSIANAADVESAVRSASFSLVGVIVMAAVLTLPRDADAFSSALAFAGLAILGLCYAGLILFPDAAIHGADELEAQHAGFWRGAFTHKNIAGPVMACLSFAGIYLWRRGQRAQGALIFAAAMIFLANTGSKTTLGLAPLCILLAAGPGLIGLRGLAPAIFVLATIGTALATLGIVFIEPLGAIADQLVPGLTYTGRTALWEFSGEMIARRPWTGYGFDSFWGAPVVVNSDQPFDRAWDISGIVHGHNGYLDLAALMGLPALAAVIAAFIVAPIRDYARTPLLKENVLLADLFMMVFAFTALNAFLESFFFRRADPVWLFFVLSVLGLRLTARFEVPRGRPNGLR